MPINSDQMIQNIRTEFETLLDFVTGEEARTTTADHVERGLFRMLLSLGAHLLMLFFIMRSQACSRDPIQTRSGEELSYHSEKKRTYFSIFGKIPFWRPYFYKEGGPGQSPLDAELSLGEGQQSDLLRELTEYLGVYVAYSKVGDMLKRFFDLDLSTRVLQQAIAEDAAAVEAYYAQKPAPAPAEEGKILVLQADGKGVPMVLEEPAKPTVRLGKGEKRGHKKEAVVTTVYTIDCAPRTPEAVVASFFHLERDRTQQAGSSHPRPQNKHVWATLAGKDAALARLAQQVAQRQGDHIRYKVALCDGCEALQSRIQRQFPDFHLVLDFVHANEYLWKVANSLLGETHEQRIDWVVTQTLGMLSGQTAQIIADFRNLAQEGERTAAQREQLLKTAAYFERNLPSMDYPTYLAQGWPIASGAIEGACRHFVKDRFELSGMRWSEEGAESLLRLRAVAENGDWDAYHDFRKRQRHKRLYHTPFPDSDVLEKQVFDSQQTPQNRQTTRPKIIRLQDRLHHRELPLAA